MFAYADASRLDDGLDWKCRVGGKQLKGNAIASVINTTEPLKNTQFISGMASKQH